MRPRYMKSRDIGGRRKSLRVHPEVVGAVWSAGFSPLRRREVQRVGEFQATIAVPMAKRRERRAPSPTTRGCTESLRAHLVTPTRNLPALSARIEERARRVQQSATNSLGPVAAVPSPPEPPGRASGRGERGRSK